MASSPAIVICTVCHMYSLSISVGDEGFTCDKCWEIIRLTEKVLELETRIQTLVEDSKAPFTQIPENTRVMCCCICSRIVRFAAFTLPVIFRNLCVRSHTTRKDPVKTRDLSCDVYNARSPFH